MKSSPFHVLLTVIFLGLFLVPACSALQVDLSPTTIQEGGQVTISIHGLANNSIFAIRIESETMPKADGTFDFRTTGFFMPFVLENGYFFVEASNVMNKPPDNIAAGLKAKPPGSSGVISMQEGEYPEGIVQIYDRGRTIPAGTFDFISIFGNAKNGAAVVPVSFEMNGKKKGPADSEIRFNIFGVSSGAANIIVMVDGNPVLSRKVTIGTPPPTTTATTVATSVPVTTSTTSSATTTSPVNQPFVPTTYSVAATPITQAPDAISESSMDKRCELRYSRSAVSGSSPEELRIMNVGGLPLSNGLNALSNTYLVYPDTARFSQKATMILTMDDTTVQGFDQYQPFIAMYTGGQWNALDSTREGSLMRADISGGGKYALATRSAIVPPTATAQQTISSAGSPKITVSRIPTSSPVTGTETLRTEMSPTQKSGPAPISGILVAVIAVLLVTSRRNK